MGRPKKVRTAEEEAAYREARRAADRERARRRRSDPIYMANEAAAKRRRQADPEYTRRAREKDAARKRAMRSLPGIAQAEYERRGARASTGSVRFALGETLPAADGVKAQTVRVHRTGRSWPLVMCPHHSTSEAEALGVATADFSAVFPDIDFKQAAEVACDKPPFIEDSLVSTTCRVEPWRGLQDKCVGEYEAVLQHAERFCQTEHHITLVQCRKPQVSTCSVEVQADPWCQHHCGIGPIGVDLCET
ncbi:uncharacterized protein LOC119453068 isoform X19 [Dermacentor silvarum]|nr:uncharacterized protein LOC119453068 isoform X19 [Dermacentor silvarum]XP_049523484.1 uncharacterized protein LOC119453068 isoform X19 [Dermacentor silvarum]